jgi:tyrosine-protein phosphatase YwqE
MWARWRRKQVVPLAGVQLGWDLHSHLVPGVDDGAATVEDALVLVDALVGQGYRGAVVTPHVHSDLYPNTPEGLAGPFAALQAAVLQRHPEFQLRLAAEYLIDERFERLVAEDRLLDFAGVDEAGRAARCVLVEFGFSALPPMTERVLFELARAGYQPVIAHIERYPFLDLAGALRWADRGALLTVNGSSLAGAYGPQVQALALGVIRAGRAAALCSDAHALRHVEALAVAVAVPEVREALEREAFVLNRSLGGAS